MSRLLFFRFDRFKIFSNDTCARVIFIQCISRCCETSSIHRFRFLMRFQANTVVQREKGREKRTERGQEVFAKITMNSAGGSELLPVLCSVDHLVMFRGRLMNPDRFPLIFRSVQFWFALLLPASARRANICFRWNRAQWNWIMDCSLYSYL